MCDKDISEVALRKKGNVDTVLTKKRSSSKQQEIWNLLTQVFKSKKHKFECLQNLRTFKQALSQFSTPQIVSAGNQKCGTSKICDKTFGFWTLLSSMSMC